jgi:hypothetical protein
VCLCDGRVPSRSAWVFVLVFDRFFVNKLTTYSSLLMKMANLVLFKKKILNSFFLN